MLLEGAPKFPSPTALFCGRRVRDEGLNMYCVVYEFTVAKHNVDKFKKLWHELTLCIKQESNSLGSRLHQVTEGENTWVAYAQWPSKEIYESTPEKVSYEDVRQRFLTTCTGIKIVYQMECIDNLFVSEPRP